MLVTRIVGFSALTLAVAVATAPLVPAQSARAVDVSVFAGLTWRSLGPFRAGRATAATASPELGVFFEGVQGAGLWKTTDNGLSWQLAFDAAPHGAIGAVAVATATPSIVYAGLAVAGSAAGASDALFKSEDGGRTWTATALRTAGAVTAIAIDPKDASRVWVAVGSGGRDITPDRGLYRSTTGGRVFERLRLASSDTPIANVLLDPSDSSTLLIVTESGASSPSPTLLKSTDGGTLWRSVGSGLPMEGTSNLAIAIATSSPTRLYASVAAGSKAELFRSDNGGDTWSATGAATPVAAAAMRRMLWIDPENADALLLASGRIWSSTDGGRTLSPWASAPVGDDVDILVHGSARGTMAAGGGHGLRVTVNAGQSWSSPFTQPTAEITEISTDTAFPFRICGTQTGTGPLCVPSRIETDRIGLPQWQLVPLRGRVMADPNDADVMYAGDGTRFDRRTGQAQDVKPPDFQGTETSPLAFSSDGHTLYLADTAVRRNTTGAQVWATLGAGLASAEASPATARPRMTALAASTIDSRTLWAGRADGTVSVTRDGGITWTTGLVAEGRAVLHLEPSHFDARSAYATVVTHSGGPVLSRTRDAGVTWQPIINGLTNVAQIFVVREDPFRRGLLLAGTDRSMFVSFDDGESWRSWQLNLPATSVRDITIRDAVVIAATGGRGLWMLDDINPIRQMTPDIARADAFLFRAATAYRMRATAAMGEAGDAVMPDAGPEGAILSYFLGPNTRGPVTLEVIETATNDVIRRFDLLAAGAATTGLHRVVWDLRYSPPTSAPGDRGPVVVPGSYQLRLTTNGAPQRQAVLVRMDPRSRVAAADLSAQLALARRISNQLAASDRALASAAPASRSAIQDVMASLRQLALAVAGADVRPSAELDAAVSATIARAAVLSAREP